MLHVALFLAGAVALVSSNEELLSGGAAIDLIAPQSIPGKPLKNQEAVINYINQKQSLWTAGKNFDDDVSEDYLKRLASARLPEKPLPMLKVDKSVADDYPENFDAREKWTKCPSISHIYDQGNCGSCWAVAVASVITDRTCIKSDGKFTSHISAQEIMSCCTKCGYGCNGGWPDKAFKFYQKHGVSTGGGYDSKEGCIPYEIKPCSHHIDGRYPGCSTYNMSDTPVCRTKCSNSQYKVPRKQDRHFGHAAYEISANDMKHELSHHGPVNAIFSVYEDFFHYKTGDGAWTVCRHGAKYQLNDFGPITVAFTVYEDFFTYKSGIYYHTWGKKVGYHVVRLLGWGKENGQEYWLAANSWNDEWGDKGTFKIRANVDECNFEEFFSLSFPKDKKHHVLL